MMLLIAAVSMRAQYPFFPTGSYSGWGSPYEPGTLAWCWQQQQEINAQRAYIEYLRQQELIFYRQQSQQIADWITNHPFEAYPGQVITRDGFVINYELVSSYRSDGQCFNCNGRGHLLEKYYMGNNHVSTVKRRCAICRGTGKAK